MFFSFRLIMRGAAMAALKCSYYYRRDWPAFSIIKKIFFDLRGSRLRFVMRPGEWL
jgi:hypothetical protein